MLWAWLSQAWSEWRSALVLVKPDTVLAWHRRGFRVVSTWKSRRRTGRPGAAREVHEHEDAPASRPVTPLSAGRIVEIPQGNGLHHRYDRAVAWRRFQMPVVHMRVRQLTDGLGVFSQVDTPGDALRWRDASGCTTASTPTCNRRQPVLGMRDRLLGRDIALIHARRGIALTDPDRDPAIDAMRIAAEKRVEGSLGNSRRQHYSHAPLLVASCVAFAPKKRAGSS